VEQSWWNFEDDMWGRFGGIAKKVFGQNLWNCEDGVWGRFGVIVKTMYAI